MTSLLPPPDADATPETTEVAEQTPNKVTIVDLLIAAAAAPLVILWRAYVASILTDWFIAKGLDFSVFVGAMLIYVLLLPRRTTTETQESPGKILAWTVIIPGFTLFLGFLFHLVLNTD